MTESQQTDRVEESPRSEVPPKPRRGFSLSTVLATSFGMLVLVAVLVVLLIGLWSGRRTALELQGELAAAAIGSISQLIERQLEPAEAQVRHLSRLIATGEIDVKNKPRLIDTLRGALAASPQVRVVVFVDTDHRVTGVNRNVIGGETVDGDASSDPVVIAAIAEGAKRRELWWGEPVWREQLKATLLNLRQPVWQGDDYLGLFVALVAIEDLSAQLSTIESDVFTNAFVLYDRDAVLAHGLLAQGFVDVSYEQPLPRLSSFADPVLASVWDAPVRETLPLAVPDNIKAEWVRTLGEEYIFLYADLTRFGDKVWTVGTYFREQDVNEALVRLINAMIAGVVALLLAVLGAFVLARRIVRPVTRLADAARHLARLDFDDVRDLPHTGLRELNEQAIAFNSLLRGLRWFEVYVPRTLVRRLLRQAEVMSLASDMREVTVLFTDIGGFTPLAEDMSADQLAAFLNEHFTLLGAAVNAEEGTVDKFIGDAMMAFWGAPETQPDHALRACRAALAMADAMHRQNEARQQSGLAPVRLRVGVHCGPVVVGNIGTPDRMNYTIVGDTVNVAQRLEALGKTVAEPDDDIVILTSGDVIAVVGDAVAAHSIGFHTLQGRSEPVEIFRLA